MSSIADPVEQIQVLRLHADDDGLIWYGDDYSLGSNSYLEAADFVSYDLGFDLESVRGIRLLGTANNAELILELQKLRFRSPTVADGLSITVGSPAICRTNGNLREPEAVLHYLWQPESNLSWQWHPLSGSDHCSYALAASLRHQHGAISDKVRRIAEYHPAWPALSFVPDVDVDAACYVLAAIIDPRWYVHYTHPHRLSKLLAHLGVTPKNVAAYLGDGLPDRHYERASLVIGTWYNQDSVAAYNRSARDTPNDFLWRIFASQDTAGKGILRSTERLVSLIYHVWLYSVSPPHPEVVFEPSLFFKTEDESRAFENHRRQTTKI